jgi:hypothetical protein
MAGSKSVKKKGESCRQRITRKHNGIHSCESSSATINWLANMLGTVLKQYNGASASRIRPQCLTASRHFLQSHTSLRNSTLFSSKVQTSTYKRKKMSQKQQYTNRERRSRKKTHIATSRRQTRQYQEWRIHTPRYEQPSPSNWKPFLPGKRFSSYSYWLG